MKHFFFFISTIFSASCLIPLSVENSLVDRMSWMYVSSWLSKKETSDIKKILQAALSSPSSLLSGTH